MGKLAEELDQRGALPRETSVDEAADVLWMLGNPANYRWFVVERGWSPERYAKWLGDFDTDELLLANQQADGSWPQYWGGPGHASITIEAYIYWAGEIGLVFAKALTAKAKAGVKVKILLDEAISPAEIRVQFANVATEVL
jgi:hypothetical protein